MISKFNALIASTRSPSLRRTFSGLLRLARYKEYTFFVTITTLLGVSAAGGEFGFKLIFVLAANWLAVAFAFMINDVEDADDDALNPLKINRNPVSARDLTPRVATGASWFVAAVSAGFYALVGLWPFVLGIISLALGFFYSWRPVRFKNMPLIDLASHCMMLAGLQFLPAMLAFNTQPSPEWLFPFFFIVNISLYGELFNELRDLDGDLKAGLNHTASKLGYKPTYWLMMIIFGIGVACGVITFLVLNIIPTWVIILMVILSLLLIVRPALRARSHGTSLEMQESFQKPLEIAAAFAMLIQFVAPWIGQIVNLPALMRLAPWF
jgi:4-hydroxybenzoate polyprenyltransferase